MTDDGLSDLGRHDLTIVEFLNLKNHNFIQTGMSGWVSGVNKHNKFAVGSQPLIPN